MKTAKEIKAEDIKKMQEKIGKLPQEEKDKMLATLILVSNKTIRILRTILPFIADIPKAQKNKINGQIEQSLSIGPSWLNYTVKTKKKKKS